MTFNPLDPLGVFDDLKAALSFRGATPGATLLRLPYYIRTGTTPRKGFDTWLKVMEGQIRTTKLPWER